VARVSALLFCCISAAVPGGASGKLKIALAGDSTVNQGTGWGPGFSAAFSPDVEVLNFARNGRSSKSFRDEGAWQPALAAKPDFILIQFGHNDQPGKGPDRETDPATTYRRNIMRYVNEARAAGAKAVLVTSIVRRNFSAERKFQPDALAAYAEEVRKIGAEMRVPVIDLYTATREQAERLGPERSEEIGRRDAAGKLDRTHLGPKGRHDIGEMAARELARLEPSLRPYLKPSGAVDYRVVVAADGSGDYKTIQYAVDHAPTLAGRERLIIEIRPGTYNERVKVPQDRPRVTFQGSDAGATVITYNMSAKAAGGTFLSATVTVDGAAFEAENITFENTFGVTARASMPRGSRTHRTRC
jgi:pectinesterase